MFILWLKIHLTIGLTSSTYAKYMYYMFITLHLGYSSKKKQLFICVNLCCCRSEAQLTFLGEKHSSLT